MVVFEYLPPLCVHVCLCAFVCVHAYTFLWHCVNFHTHTVYTTHLKWRMPRVRERRMKAKATTAARKAATHHTHRQKNLCCRHWSSALPLSVSPSRSISFSFSHFLFCRVACGFLRVFGYSFWFCFPSHTYTHLHINMYECVQRLCFCVCHFVDCLCMLTMLCFFLPLIAAPRSRLQIFSNQKRDHV